jgi:hypothetical protein
MPLPLAPNGGFAPVGQFAHRREFDVIDGSAPSWVTPVGSATPGGTEAPITPIYSTTGVPDCALVTPSATIGALAGLTTSFALDSTAIKMMKITLQGLWFDSPSPLFALGFFDGGGVSRGARIRDEAMAATGNGSETMLERFGPSTSRLKVDYQIKGRQEYARKRNLSFVLLPATKEMYLLENDKVFGYRQAADMVLASGGSSMLKPWVRLSSTVAGVVSLHFQRFIVEWEN